MHTERVEDKMTAGSAEKWTKGTIVEKAVWGQGLQGQQVYLYTLSNANGMKVRITNFGATVTGIQVPGRDGKLRDVVLGYDCFEDCLADDQYLGVIVGPVANCIENARFTMDGVTYELEKSDGKNNQHSHTVYGYHKRYWDGELMEDGVRLSLCDSACRQGNPGQGSLDCMGFPGQKKVSVTYRLSQENEFSISYCVQSDCKTVLNPTSHIYFNLEGHDYGGVADHSLQISAAGFTPIREGIIPTGELRPVEGTPLDFRSRKPIGQEIDAEYEQLKIAEGYDHNFVLDQWDGRLRQVAQVWAPVSGIGMLVYTTLPGLQFYTANGLVHQPGKGSAIYEARSALCLETQYFPNSVNLPAFPSCFFEAGEAYRAETVYRFQVESPGSIDEACVPLLIDAHLSVV